MQTRSPKMIGNGGRRLRARAPFARRCRRATAVLELVVALPILLLLSVATIQFGLFFANMQQIALACRVGAEEASQTAALPTTDGAPVPDNVIHAINQQLLTSGIEFCRVRLEHNVGGSQVALVSAGAQACECRLTTNLSDPLPSREYVRLSICVPLREIMPNALRCLGLNVCDPCKVAEGTTVMRYELTDSTL